MAGINVGDVGSRAPPPPTSSKLTDAERKDAALAIEVFGEPMVSDLGDNGGDEKMYPACLSIYAKLHVTLHAPSSSVPLEGADRQVSFP